MHPAGTADPASMITFPTSVCHMLAIMQTPSLSRTETRIALCRCCILCGLQITMDDKGVALIFVFGLPGFLKHNHPGSCAESAGKVLDALNVKGISFSAGLTTGPVFCGLVGNPSSRCEYAMMGGMFPPSTEGGGGGLLLPELPCSEPPVTATTRAETIIDNTMIASHNHADMVNTAARLAGYGLKNGVRVVCMDEYKKDLARYQEGVAVSLEEIGTTKLKGKDKEVTVCRVTQVRRTISMWGLGAKSEQASTVLHGRASDIESMVEDVRSLATAGYGMVLVKAGAGVGKSAVLHSLATELVTPHNENNDSGEGDNLSPLVLEFQLDHGHMNIPMGTCHGILAEVLQRKGHMELGTTLGSLEVRGRTNTS